MEFQGVTYSPEDDKERLSTQLEKVRDLMLDGEWRTLPQIKASVGGSEAGISARLRDLRKESFGGFVVNRRRVGAGKNGVWQYQVLDDVKYRWESHGQAVFL